MKKVYYLMFCLFFSCIVFAQNIGFQVSETDDDKILWNAERKLTWNDFKGKPTTHVERVAAMTSTEFIVQTKTNNSNSKVEVYIENIFVCHESWVRQDKKIVEGLLAHEQGHFDLNEANARKLRSKIRQGINFEEVEKLIQEAYQLSTHDQDLYDNETNHGIDKIKQKAWLIKIANDLQKWE